MMSSILETSFSALKIPLPICLMKKAEQKIRQLWPKRCQFARTIQRLQRSVVSGLEKIGIIHLYTLGFRGDDLVSFRLKINNPSKIAELQELEHWKQKFDIAGGATENFSQEDGSRKTFSVFRKKNLLETKKCSMIENMKQS